MNNPTLMPIPFAINGAKNDIQVTRQGAQDPEDATLNDGFPAVTMQPVETGGLPPKGMDFNGIFYEISDNVVFQSKGGWYKFDSSYADAIGGYPKDAILLSDDSAIAWKSLSDNNKINFNTAPSETTNQFWEVFITSGLGRRVSALESGKANKATTLAGYGITDGIKIFNEESELPKSDIGTIWHDKYDSLMKWVVYDANGANYAGYASVGIGKIRGESQQIVRTGSIKAGVERVSQITYSQLWNWAKHNGLVRTSAQWTAGTLFYRDNNDGTFTPPDVRGEFERYWDDGRGVDEGREFGSWQGDAIRDISGSIIAFYNSGTGAFRSTGARRTGNPTDTATNNEVIDFKASYQVPVANQNRPRSFATLPVIKF